jgi:hypothetical protein
MFVRNVGVCLGPTIWLRPDCLRRIVWAIALVMAAASISETSVNFYQTTRRNDPEDSLLHICRRENLKFTGPTSPHDVTTQKANIDLVTALRT